MRVHTARWKWIEKNSRHLPVHQAYLTLFTDRRKRRLYLWLAAIYSLLLFLSTIAKYSDHFFAVVMNTTWSVVYLTAVNFILHERSVPFVLKKRRFFIINILWAIVIVFAFLMLASFGAYLWRKIGIAFHLYTPLRDFTDVSEALENITGSSVGSYFAFGMGRHIHNYVRLKQAEQQLRIEKQAAELNYLRSQTNPHFLFNTLNNIYSLARDKSDLAAESIMRLSKLLRFMLYETSADYIAIEREIQMISDYIDLEKLRYDESLQINFNHDIEDMRQSLPPLLLMPLVENSFKHGVSETRERPFVDIHLSVKKRELLFIVKNSIEPSSASAEQVRENIGLTNLRRQLELLFNDYNLVAQPQINSFVTTLRINLSSHV